MTTQHQIESYLTDLRRYCHAQTVNNPLVSRPDIQAYPAILKQPVRGLVERQAGGLLRVSS